MRKEEFFEVLGELDDDILKDAQKDIKKTSKKQILLKWGAIAACLVMTVSFMQIAIVAEAREYDAAVAFFDENGLSTEGLSRADVKAVYRDITSQHFTYDKTAEVIEQAVPGLEIEQRQPSPEELAKAWNMNMWNNAAQPQPGISYQEEILYKPDESLGFDVPDKSILDCYRDGELIWTAEFTDFILEDSTFTSSGTAVWGYNHTWSSEQLKYPYLARVDDDGNILWQYRLNHGFKMEYVTHVLENEDGTWGVISRGDLNYLCLSRYDIDGNELSFCKTEVGNMGIWNAVRFGDGYLVQIGHKMDGETARLVKLDSEGNLLDSFVYESEDCDYTITDMIEFEGRVYLSAYAVPKQKDEGGRHEISNILAYIFDGKWDISGEELTSLVRGNYTAVLLLCDSTNGVPQNFYSVKGSLGAKLAVNSGGKLVWDVESITNTFFSPATSSFTIGGTSQVFSYTFDNDGTLISQEDTGETVPYRR